MTPQLDGAERFGDLITELSLRPCMYVTKYDVGYVAAFLEGYACAMATVEPGFVKTWSDFQSWVEASFGICSPKWHWSDILLYGAGSHQGAIESIPPLLDGLTSNGPLENLPEWVYQQVRVKRGSGLYSPDGEHPSVKTYPVMRNL